MEAAERLSVHGSSGGTSAGFPPRVQRGAPDHHGPGTLAEGSLSGRGLVGSGNLGRWPGVQRGLQRRHVQQPVSRALWLVLHNAPHPSGAAQSCVLEPQHTYTRRRKT